MTRIYIAGPMTGLPDHNYPAFVAVAARLRAAGHDVVSPHELNAGLEHEGYAACMRRDVIALAGCDAIHLLSGWENSRGARMEWRLAEILELEVHASEVTP